MERLTKLILTLTVLLLLLAGCSATAGGEGSALGRITSAPDSPPPRMGAPAPDFTYRTPEGAETSLSQLKGRVVLLNFWSSDCPPCVEQMPYLEQVHTGWKERGLTVLAINLGESEPVVSEFVREHSLSLSVLLDEQLAAGASYKAVFTPVSYVIDKNGIIQGVKIGPFADVQEIERGIAPLFRE